MGWHKSMPSTPQSLPTGWVECNGQILSDGGSVYNGQVIPNLNGAAAGANSPGQSTKEAMFLRGDQISGTGQPDAFQGHWHTSVTTTGTVNTPYNTPVTGTNPSPGANYYARDASTDGVNGVPRTANETRPKNMSVVWIMRIK